MSLGLEDTRHLDSNVHVCHGGVSRKAILRVIYILRICKLHVINCNFVAGFWDTASVQDFSN